jgi:hypothetical protein
MAGTKRIKKSAAETLQDAMDAYRHAHGDKPFRTIEAASWAYRRGLVAPRPFDAIKMLAKEMSRAAREEYYEDPQGRRVRKKHARREAVIIDGEEKQLVFWDDILTAQPEHMRVAFQQRRAAIVYDCLQHKTDVDSYNDNNIHGTALPLFSYNVDEDLAELGQDTHYPDSRPYDEEGDEDEDGEPGVPV